MSCHGCFQKWGLVRGNQFVHPSTRSLVLASRVVPLCVSLACRPVGRSERGVPASAGACPMRSAGVRRLSALLALGALVCAGARIPLDQQVTKESQDARGGTWPPPAVFEMPAPVRAARMRPVGAARCLRGPGGAVAGTLTPVRGRPVRQMDLIASVLELAHKDKLQEALGVLHKAAREVPDSHEVALQLGFVYCALGKTGEARRHLEQGLPPLSPLTDSALTTAGGPYDSGDTVLEAAVRERLASDLPCTPLPLLYPSTSVVQEAGGAEGKSVWVGGWVGGWHVCL